MNREQQILVTLACKGPGIILQSYRANCCIAAAAIGQEVLRHFGIESAIVCASVHVLNAGAVAWMEKHHGLPKDKAERKEWRKRKCWIISVEATGEIDAATNGFNGHLVLLTRSLMLDLSLFQFHRPERGIDMGAAPPLFPRQVSQPWSYRAKRGVEIIYVPVPKLNYEQAKDWQPSPERSAVTQSIITALESALKERSDGGTTEERSHAPAGLQAGLHDQDAEVHLPDVEGRGSP